MKIVYRLLLALLISLFLFGCSDKTAGIEGKIVDGRGQPISGLSVIFKQVQPSKGYEQFETKTGPDGIFRLMGVMPSSEYIITPLSVKWKTKVTKKLTTLSEGQNLVLNAPIVIRFNAMKDGTFVDTKTGLQWLIYPVADLNSGNVVNTVRSLKEGGFTDWRLPAKEELLGLQEKAPPAKTPAEPVLIQKTCCAWVAEPNTENVDWKFYIEDANELWESSKVAPDNRVIIVRTFKAAPPEAPSAAGTSAPAAVSPTAPESEPAKAATSKTPLPPAKSEPGVLRASRKACIDKRAQAPVVALTTAAPVAKSAPSPAAKAEPAKKVEPVKKGESTKKIEPIKTDNSVTLYFALSKSTLSAEELAKLKAFYAKIKGNSGRIVIEGNSDAGKIRNSTVNLRISIDRSYNVVNMLKKMGLSDKTQIELKGMGDAKPAAENDSEEGRKLNRRVDVTFITE